MVRSQSGFFVVSEIFNIANEPMKKGQSDKTSPDSFIGASKVISHAKEKQFA